MSGTRHVCPLLAVFRRRKSRNRPDLKKSARGSRVHVAAIWVTTGRADAPSNPRAITPALHTPYSSIRPAAPPLNSPALPFAVQ